LNKSAPQTTSRCF